MRQITVDDRTYELAERLAERRNRTVEEVVSDAVRLGYLEDPCSIIGALVDDADLLDRIVEDAMQEREARPLRAGGG